MNTIGEIVVHKVFGKGTIIAFDKVYLSVRFDSQPDIKKFCYPEVFDQFLEAESKEFRDQIELDQKEFMQKQQQIQREKEKARAAELLIREASKPVEKKSAGKGSRKKPDIMNLAIKCTYCDGGATKNSVGYRGVCSDPVIKYNIDVAKRVWCSQSYNRCTQYHQGLITREELEREYENTKNEFGESICYESQMLQIWAAGAGFYHHGEREGQPMKLVNAGPNSLALLTTRVPYASEDQRMIFAAFLVYENFQGDDWEEGYIGADKTYRLELTPEEAEKMKFWNYYFNPNKPDKMVFGSGLHRYLTDQQGAQVLKDICRIKKGADQEALAVEFLHHYCELKDLDVDRISQPVGPLSRFE